jgi:hypothetical protein
MEGFDVDKVQAALAANRTLQGTIQAELLRLQQAKHENRLRAAALVEQYLAARLERSSAEPSIVPAAHHSGRWKHRFFEDDHGNTAPTIYDGGADPERRDFFRRQRPPWSTKESKHLVKTVQSAIAANFPANERYDRVAGVLKPPPPSSTENAAVARRRTAEECRIEYVRQCEKPLNKIEIQKLESLVAAASAAEAEADSSSSSAEGAVDWIATAATMSVGRAVPCSAFQCLAVWKKIENGNNKKKKASAAAPATWTPEEDRLLLKFILAAGPQLMLDVGHPLVRGKLAREVFPDKSIRAIVDRMHSSSLNPKLAQGDWTDNEERKLIILMKMYGGDLQAASTHLARAPKAVSDKWQRTLNPEYLTGPFTKDDDAKLVMIVRSQPELGWRDIARQHFPERHPQRLMNRWLDLATDQDIIAREQKTRKRSRQQKTKRI